ncbi:OLC1v1032087C1 [Oldenlandia corymbosa var. corymbosa]|uniref:OLC1v1032087C1 n=1 Tax=Oldenlandia corymbosa var. corymbosa TaxID=529605 RepID=A0AAV1CKE4_OLDCO|nr:OLC1v1032087C1 [Oldenlandia corymbosa var. corymbosa]
MAVSIPTQLKFKPPNPLLLQIFHPHLTVVTVRTQKSNICGDYYVYNNNHKFNFRARYGDSSFRVKVSDDGGSVPHQPSSSEVDALRSNSSAVGDSYVALFIRMLGLDNNPLDRELAIVTVWKYSLGGKSCVDNIMQFGGVVNLTVNLLKSDSDSACEAASGVLRMISSFDEYRLSVAESGAIEEITGLLRRSSISSNVKEQSLGTLWNLSADENPQRKICNQELLLLLIKYLEDEDVKVKETAAAVLGNLALAHSTHKIMVEAGIIPALAKLLTSNEEGQKVIRKEARRALLEIAKDDYYKILLLEEGLVLVPLIGSAAYKSFKPALYSWPSLPDGSKLEQNAKGPSRYGASELLIGLNDQDQNLDEAKMNAIVGRTQQQFLARIGAIETEDDDQLNQPQSSCQRFTLLPWIDGVARLVLILGLDDDSAIARAADSIADSSINEHMRVSFKEAGAIKHLCQLLHHPNETVRLPVIRALERLTLSNNICQMVGEEGAVSPLIDSLKNSDISASSTEMILNILSRIWDPNKEMKLKFYDAPVNGSRAEWNRKRNSRSPGHLKDIAESKSGSSTQTMDAGGLVDSAFLSRLVDILKTPSPSLQKKAASILEYFTINDMYVEKFISVDIAAGLDVLFNQNYLSVVDVDSAIDVERPEFVVLKVEEAGRAISAACRLLTRLLDFGQFCSVIDIQQFTLLLRKILKSEINVHDKDWVAASLVKLGSISGPNLDLENPVTMDVTLYETIPRLIEKIKTSFSQEVQEAAVLELNRIISEGVVDSTRAVAAEGGIFTLVKLLETGNERAIEAGLMILYNLSMDTENHAAIIAAGAVPILRRIVLSQKPQWTQALRLLRVLPT